MAGHLDERVEGFGGMRIVDGKLSFYPEDSQAMAIIFFQDQFWNRIVKVLFKGKTGFRWMKMKRCRFGSAVSGVASGQSSFSLTKQN
jgi:trehalose/maltose hydrolase-like predicted phosphorylase